MRITIDTDDPAGAKLLTAQAASDLHPALDAGAAPIDHIRRLSGVAGTETKGADFNAPASFMAQESVADGGRSSHAAAARLGDGDKARELPLNPLRAGAAMAAAQRGVVLPRHESARAATDAGPASAAVANEKPESAGVAPGAAKKAGASSAKTVKTNSKR